MDTTIPALNPEETAAIPKERRKRYMPPQFSLDMFGMGEEKIRRGDKRIDPRSHIIQNYALYFIYSNGKRVTTELLGSLPGCKAVVSPIR